MAVNIPIWPGSGSAVGPGSGSTPFGFYDSDADFQNEAPKVAKWCALSLGYPIQDVEMQDINFYANFEQAITEYSSQVNQYNAKQNMLRLQGASTSSNLTQKSITPGLGGIISISDTYGQEALVGGNVELRRAYFTATANTQSYDLWSAVSSSFVSQGLAVPERPNIEIKRVFHSAPPAIVRYFDPFAGTGMGTYSMLAEFGWTNYSVATSFMMLPIYADILRLQAIEFNDEVRRSGYGFEIVNNKIKVFPVPQYNLNVWFDYILKSDRSNPLAGAGATSGSYNGVSDLSNVPFDNMVYSQINDIGKQWIRRYTLALSKITLGGIRAKYSTIPIPNNEVSLDGGDLRNQGETERVALVEELRTTLDEMTRNKQLEKEAQEKDNLQKSLTGIPLKIYIG